MAGFIANENSTEFEVELYKFAKAMKEIKIVTTLEFNILARKLIGPNEKHVFLPDSHDMWIFVNEGKYGLHKTNKFKIDARLI